MAEPPRQLLLDLPVAVSYRRDDYVVGTTNRAAFDLVGAPGRAGEVVVLIGPEGAGKTHLAGLFAEATGAPVLAAADLAGIDPLTLATAPALVVEDAGPGLDERALFHLLNAVRQHGGRVLITAREVPAAWGLTLPDLVSRLRAATPVEIGLPDDALLAAVLAKLFADRQTTVDPAVIAFLARRIERSFAAAVRTVEALDRAALAAKAPIGRAMAARVVGASDEGPQRSDLDEDGEAENNPSR